MAAPGKSINVCLLLCLLLTIKVWAEEPRRVYLDVLPPFLDQSGQGLSRDLFLALGRAANIQFDIRAGDYDRIKLALRRGDIDIAGHTAYRNESAAFYRYAVELDFAYPVVADLYVTDPSILKRVDQLRVGTVRGNRPIAARATGLSSQQFVELSSLDHLFRNLKRGTLDAVWFERAASLKVIDQRGIRVYYRQLPRQPVPISYAVARTTEGLALKRKLDQAFPKVDLKAIFGAYQRFLSMPAEGWVGRASKPETPEM